jgi:putative acetyltransferase
MDIQIRNESKNDIEHIHRVITLAFQHAPHTCHIEQFIVKALRRADALVLSQLAEKNGQVIGHIAISPVSISDDTPDWFGLGPISVLPEHQRKGVGSKLIQNALADLRGKQAEGCVVLGEPNFYVHFGFTVVDGLVYPGAPAEYFQAMSFSGNFPQGMVAYHDAFSVHGECREGTGHPHSIQ